MLALDEVKSPLRRGRVGRAVGFVRPYLFGLASAAYLFTVGWIRSRNRGLIVELCRHFGYPYNVREQPTLPVIALDEITDEQVAIDVRALDTVDGNVTDRELIAICRLVRQQRPQAMFEFGTFDGRTTLNMAANAPNESRVYTLDLPPQDVPESRIPLDQQELRYASKPESGSRFKGTEVETRIVQLYGDSGRFDFSPYASQVDFIFIDGSHVYEYVINDSLLALQMLRNGRGTIVWHDYSTWDGVTRALHDLARRHRSFKDVRRVEGTTLALLQL
ncbi:MAG TPA: class I SAM-dependent methyltransferase [Gemmatimonadaceae bacterium]